MKAIFLTLTITTASLLAAPAPVPAAAPPPSPTGTIELSRVHYPMETGNTIGDAMALAAEQALQGGTGPKYPSNPSVANREYTAFEGSVTFSAPKALAIFSDDGCRVTIKQNGATICFFDRYGKGQHLPSLSQSFHILPVTLQANVTYHIEVWYSNILYRGTTDIDGATLFSFDPPLEFVDMDGEKVNFATSFSDPHPVVSLEVVNVEVINDSTRPPDHPLGTQTDLVAITFRGTVVDALADIVEGGKANISQVFVHGHPEPISVEPDPNEVNFRSSLRPYPFKGRFEKTVILPVTNGYNALVVTATNVLGNTGANTIGIEAFVEYELGEEHGEIVIVAGKAYVDTVEVEGGTEVGLTNPIRVYVNDSSVQPESVANTRLRFFGQDFGLEFKDDQLQADRPFMVVAKPVPADIPNVINLLNHPDATPACYRGYCASLAWAYTAHSPPAQFKYASGTSISHQIISDEFKRLSVTDIAGLPRIVTRNGQPDNSVEVLGFDIVDIPDKPKVRALRMTLKLQKSAHTTNPTKSILVDVNGRSKPLAFKDNLRAVPVKVVICAIDGGGYEALKFAIKDPRAEALHAANFAEVFGSAENWDDAALAHLPSVTWCNWSSVFSGNDPKGHGILGNAFFGREWEGGTPTPFACAAVLKSDLGDMLHVSLGGLKDVATFSSGSLYDKVRDEVPATESLVCASVNTFYSKSTNPNVTMKRLHYPGWPLRRKSTYFAFLVPPAGVALLFYREVSVSGHSGGVATRLDHISAEDAIRLWSSNPGKVPDVVSIYFPGPDNYAHHVGTGTLGGVLVGAITEQFKKTDAEFGRFLEHLKKHGYQSAVLFALTADHGLIGASTQTNHVVTIEEVDEFFRDGQGLEFWRGSWRATIGDCRSVYSPSGGMAHVYLRNSNGVWTQAPTQALVEQVSHALFDEATASADPALIPDLRGALGRNVGQPVANVPVILVRLTGFASPYRWLTRENNAFVTKPITDPTNDDLLHAIEIQGANSPWPEFTTRINAEMNSVRSGDIVLMMNVEAGYQTYGSGGVLGFGDPEPGSHGGPTRAEAQVPLIFNMLGVNKQFLQDALGHQSALPANKKDMRTHHMTPAVTEIMKELRRQ